MVIVVSAPDLTHSSVYSRQKRSFGRGQRTDETVDAWQYPLYRRVVQSRYAQGNIASVLGMYAYSTFVARSCVWLFLSASWTSTFGSRR